MSDDNDKIQSCQQAFSYHDGKFKSCAVNAKDFNSELISPNLNNSIESIQNKINEIKASSSDFSSTFSPILQMDNVHLLNHRLQIAKNIRNICHLYQNFCFLYDKEVSDRSILDIMKLFQLYSKLNSKISQYVKIQVCGKIKEEVDQKIINIRQMIVETIRTKGYVNLTSTELFQLIILSSSVEQFWNFLDLDESQFTTKEYDILPDNIEKLFLLFSKIEKLSNLLNQSGLNEYLVLQEKKAYFTNIIIENIKELRTTRTEIKDFIIFSDDIFEKLRKLKLINNKESFPIEFKISLNEEISNVAIFVFINLNRMSQYQFPENMKDFSNHNNPFLSYLDEFSSKLQLYINPSKYDILNSENNYNRIVALYQYFISFQYKKGFAAMPDLAIEIMMLSTYIKNENQKYIKVFKLIFYRVARFELNSIIYTLLDILNIKDESSKKFFQRDMKNAFSKDEDIRDQYAAICTKIDKSEENDHKLFNLIAQLNEIVNEKNGTRLLYEKQKQYFNKIYNSYTHKSK